MNDYIYYIAKGRSLSLAQEYSATARRHREAWVQASLEANTPGLMRLGNAYVGLSRGSETAPVPAGWRASKHGLVPARGKAGKAIANRLAASPPPRIDRLCYDLIGAWGVECPNTTGRPGLLIRFIGLEEVGDVLVLRVPAQCETAPPDAERLLTSEYWRMKEAIDGANAARTDSRPGVGDER
jgi:hypothetical protein